MKCLLLMSFVAVAVARPDVSHLSGGYNYKPPTPNAGYDYKVPHTSYGVPILPVDHHSGGASNQHYQEKPSGSYLPSNQELPSYSQVDFSGNYQSGPSSSLDGLYNPSLIQDQKHVYYFAARDLEEEQPRLRINVIPNHQKSTNVVFVKAPSIPAPVPEIHAPASTIEDKTKVVVLVKKPEQQAPINVHTPPAIKHGKPEVFVVKYKDQHEAERAVASEDGGHILGAPVDQVRSEHHFVETLKNQNDDKYRNLGNLGVSGSSESANAGLYNSNSGSGTNGIRLSSNDGVRLSSDDVSSFGGASLLGSSLADSSKDGGQSGSLSYESANAGLYNHNSGSGSIGIRVSSHPEIHAPPSVIEDKTKVVVLVKKPEQQASINIHTPPAIKHGKPEVFVVKYKDQHEAERAVASGNGGYPLGAPVDQVRSEHHFVQTLKNQNDNSGSSESVNAGLFSRNAEIDSGSIGIRLSSDDTSSFGGASLAGSSVADSSKGSSGHIAETFELGDSEQDAKAFGVSHASSSGSSFKSSSSESSFESSSKMSQGSARAFEITIENESKGDAPSSSSSPSDAVVGSSLNKTLEEDSLLSKNADTKESSPQ